MGSHIKTPSFYLPPERVSYFQSFPGFADEDTDVPPRVLNTMACYSVGIVEDMAANRPDVAIACDRGGRLFGLAIREMWRELMGEPFPTLDAKLHFAKLSGREIGYQDRRDITEYRVASRIDSALREGKRKGREPQGDMTSVLVIDDRIYTGDTFELADSIATKQKFDMRYAVMEAEGYRGVIEGQREDMRSIHDWIGLSAPVNVGVDYDSAHRFQPVPGSTESVRRTRKELLRAVERVAKFVQVIE